MKRGKINIRAAIIACASITVATIVAVTAYNASAQPLGELTIETGAPIEIGMFFDVTPEDAKFTTDITSIDTSVPGCYSLKISYDGVFNKTVILNVVDTTAPTAEAVYQHFYLGDVPDAAQCVTNVYDYSGSVTVSYCSEMTELNFGGNYDEAVKLTDCYGNESTVIVPFTVIEDHNAPLIYGPCEITCTEGGTADYMSNITVVDDYDANPQYGCNYSAVDINTPGEYPIIYWAKDEAGNYTETIVNAVVIDDKAIDYSGSAYDIAGSVYSTIRRRNKVDTARAIFQYIHDNVKYAHTGECSTLESAAYQGFTQHEGNCYVLASCCKLLLDRAGIPNMIIKRYPVTDSSHFWNLVCLNGGWYHCDATSFKGHTGIYFMLTDAQLDSYHCFDPSNYPARAGGATSVSAPATVVAAAEITPALPEASDSTDPSDPSNSSNSSDSSTADDTTTSSLSEEESDDTDESNNVSEERNSDTEQNQNSEESIVTTETLMSTE